MMKQTNTAHSMSNAWALWGDALLGFDLSLTSGFEIHGLHPDFLGSSGAVAVSGALEKMLTAVPPKCLLRFYSLQTGTYREELESYAKAFKPDTFGGLLAREKVNQCSTATAPIRRELYAFVSTPSCRKPLAIFPGWLGSCANDDDRRLQSKLAEQRELLTQASQAFTTNLRHSSIHSQCLSAPQLFRQLWRMANPRRAIAMQAPEHRPQLPLRSQIFSSGFYESSDYFVRDGCLERVVSMRLSPGQTRPLQILGLQAFPFRNITCVSVRPLHNDRSRKLANDARQKAFNWKDMAGLFQDSRRQAENPDHDAQDYQGAANTLLRRLNAGEKLCEVSVQIWFYGADEKQLNRRTEEVLSAMRSVGDMDGALEEYRSSFAYVGMLPGHHVWIGDRFHLMPSSNAAEMLPVFGEPAGATQPNYLMTTRSNALFGYHPFMPGVSAHSAGFIGPPGSGKSVAIRCMHQGHVATGGRLIGVTRGTDYERFAELNGGVAHNLDLNDPNLRLGPFLPPTLMREARNGLGKLRMYHLGCVLTLMASPNDEKLSRQAQMLIHKACALVYSNEGSETTPTFVEWMQALKGLAVSNREDREAIASITKEMRYWLEGPEAHVFSRNRVADENRVAIWNVANIDNDNTRAVILGLISSDILQSVRLGRTVVILDEVWSLLKTAAGIAMVASLYRTLRKERSSVVSATQTVNDFLHLAGHAEGAAILSGFAIVGLLKPKPLEAKTLCETFGLGDAEGLLRSMPGGGGEILLQIDSRSQMVRLTPTPLEYWMATSHPVDIAAENRLRRLYPQQSRLSILGALANRFPMGVERAAAA